MSWGRTENRGGLQKFTWVVGQVLSGVNWELSWQPAALEQALCHKARLQGWTASLLYRNGMFAYGVRRGFEQRPRLRMTSLRKPARPPRTEEALAQEGGRVENRRHLRLTVLLHELVGARAPKGTAMVLGIAPRTPALGMRGDDCRDGRGSRWRVGVSRGPARLPPGGGRATRSRERRVEEPLVAVDGRPEATIVGLHARSSVGSELSGGSQ